MDEYNKLMDLVFMHRKEAIEQTLSKVAKELDLTLANIAALSLNNPRLLRQVKALKQSFDELGMECYWFNEELKEVLNSVE